MSEPSFPAAAATFRPFNFRLGAGIPLVSMILLLVFDPAEPDFVLARLFYDPDSGFIGRHSFFWRTSFMTAPSKS
jgi:membrane-associated PAP2 superfamily phosphatase